MGYLFIMSYNLCLIFSTFLIFSKFGKINADFPYDPHVAYQFLQFATAAYSEDLGQFIPGVQPGFRLVGESEKNCQFESNCAGYVAKSIDNQLTDIIVVGFRGTANTMQLVDEIADVLLPRKEASIGGLVQPFFHEGYQLLWNDLMGMVNDTRWNMSMNHHQSIDNQSIDKHRVKLYITGHSLGGAMAALFASEVAVRGYFDKEDIYVVTFGEPRVGNPLFAMNYDALVPQTWRVVHHRDIVPHIPPCQLIPWRATCAIGTPYYYHHGTEVFYEAEFMNITSPYQICSGKPKNEDSACSNALIEKEVCYNLVPCINDHLLYFGDKVAFWTLPDILG